MLRHYVFLKYRDGTSDDHVTAFCGHLLALRATIGGIEHLEIGRDELHVIMEFATLEALRTYQRHPQHLAVMAFNAPFVADVGSVDFTSPPTGE